MLTPIVAAQCDGVHFVIENRTGSTFYFVPVHVDDEAVDYGEFASLAARQERKFGSALGLPVLAELPQEASEFLLG